MSYKTVKPEQLIEKFQFALEHKTGYIWGKTWEMWTEKKQQALMQTTDSEREQSRRYGSKWIGHDVTDCSGLFTWAFKQLGSYMYHGSNTIWNKYCVNKGEFKRGKRMDGKELKPGTALFVTSGENRSHIGLYIGNGEVIEARNSRDGVVKGAVTNRKWTEWGELKYVDYEDKPITTATDLGGTRTLRFGCKGDDVKLLQLRLDEIGYPAGAIDGIFGRQTLAAVKNFQASRGLKADGIVGPKTLAALNQHK